VGGPSHGDGSRHYPVHDDLIVAMPEYRNFGRRSAIGLLPQDDLLLGRQEGDRADLPEVHPDRVVDPEHVRGERLELLSGRRLALLRVELGGSIGGECARLGPVLVDYLDTADDRVGGCRGQVEIGVVVRIGGSDRGSARHSRHDGGLAGRWRA